MEFKQTTGKGSRRVHWDAGVRKSGQLSKNQYEYNRSCQKALLLKENAVSRTNKPVGEEIQATFWHKDGALAISSIFEAFVSVYGWLEGSNARTKAYDNDLSQMWWHNWNSGQEKHRSTFCETLKNKQILILHKMPSSGWINFLQILLQYYPT